jgi:hypothetical protein
MAQSNGALTKKTCAVRGCEEEAVVEVILYDVYWWRNTFFFERDHTCPFRRKIPPPANPLALMG